MSDILSIGASGVSAYRKSLEVTGSNIANANTEGYIHRDATLKTVGQGAASPLVVGNPAGSGVDVSVVSRATDNFLRDAVWAADAVSAQAQALSSGLGQLEKRLLMPPSTVSTTMRKFFASMQDVSNSPSSQSARIAALDSAQQIVDQFHTQVGALSQEISFSETNISATLTSTNAIIKQLAQVNAGIAATSGSKQAPNDLLDQRDKLIGDLSNLIGVTVREDTYGKVQVFLGDSASGPKLVDGQVAKTLGSTINGNKLDFVYDPGGQNTVTNQISGGSLAGLNLYRSQCLYTRDSFNQLALGFANNLNSQHEQGIDLAGNKGLPIFSTDTLSPVASQSNRGNAKVTIDLQSMSSVSNDTYKAVFDSKSKLWTVTSNNTKKSATGTSDVNIDGLSFHFEGSASDADNFTVVPLKDAAAGIRLILTDPAQWAMSLPTYADTNPSNTGTANVMVQKIAQPVPPPNLPQIQSIFGQSQAPRSGLGVKTDGVVATIPAGATNVQFSTLQTISAATFNADLNPALFKQDKNPVLKMAITENGVQSTYNLDFMGDIINNPNSLSGLNQNSVQGLADSINAELKFHQLGGKLVASATNGILAINALGKTQIKNLSLSNNDTLKNSPIAANIEIASGGTDLQVFTREGRQLSGPTLSPDQAKKLLTIANGFSADAVYLPPSDLVGYRGISPVVGGGILNVQTENDQSQTIRVAAFPETDSAQSNPNSGSTFAGAVYDLNLPSLNNVRLSGADIIGKNSTDIAKLLNDRMVAQATTQSVQGSDAIDWSGLGDTIPQFTVGVDGVEQAVNFIQNSNVTGKAPINFNSVGADPVQFSLTIDGVSQKFSFVRSRAVDGSLTNSGTVDLANPLNPDWVKMSQGWSKDVSFAIDGNNALVINLPPEVSGDTTVNSRVSVGSADDEALLGLSQISFGNSGYFVSQGSPKLNFKIDADGKIGISLPKSLDTKLPVITVSGSNQAQLAALGLDTISYKLTGAAAPPVADIAGGLPLSVSYNGQNYDISIASGMNVTGKSPANAAQLTLGVNLSIIYNGTQKTINVIGNSGNSQGISWSKNADGSLKLTASGGSLSMDPAASNVTALTSLGLTTVTTNPAAMSGLAVNNPSVSWSIGTDGRLTLSSNDPKMSIVSDTATKRDHASNLGFMGADLTVSLKGDVFSIKSSMTNGLYNVSPGADTSGSISRIAHSIQINGPAPEDLILAVQSSNFNSQIVRQGVSGTLIKAVQSVAMPQNIKATDTVTVNIPGIDIGGPLIAMNFTTADELAANIQSQIDNSTITNKPTVVYDQASKNLVFTYSDAGPKPLLSLSYQNGSNMPMDIAAHIYSNGIQPLTGVKEIQELKNFDELKIGETYSLTLKLNPLDANYSTITVGPLSGNSSSDIKSDFVNKLNLSILNASNGANPSPAVATIDSGKILVTWSLPGDVPPVSVGQPNASPNIQRSIIAKFPSDLKRSEPLTPDILVRITQPGQLEIFDKLTGKSLANRSYTSETSVNYLGLTFRINGNAQVGDSYSVITDTSRTGDNRNAILLGALQNLDAFGVGSGSFQDIYAAVASQLTSATQAANDTSSSAQQNAGSLLALYDGKTGVSLDTEAANLLRFQQAYQASAEVINTAKTMFDTILKMM